MNIIIPIGGIGKRFREQGYTKPKALIPVLGKPVLFWLLDSIKKSKQPIRAIYIPHTKEYSDYHLQDLISQHYPMLNVHCSELCKQTGGSLETIALCLSTLKIEDSPIICLDSDNFYTCDVLKKWEGDNRVVVFEDKQPKPFYSYVTTDYGCITSIVEKEKVSDMACTGAYAFRSWKLLLKEATEMIQRNMVQKGEFYTSGCIQSLILKSETFKIIHVDVSDYSCLGTPLQVRHFCANWNGERSCARFCFDLDLTLVTSPKIRGDYTSVQPITDNIRMVQRLSKQNHYIIIHTARRMVTHSANVGKIIADVGQITLDTLQEFNIPYDELHFGKPYADFYIDDKAIDACSDLEKAFGFYKTNIAPRSFHGLHTDTIEVYRKNGEDLSGEISFYSNIPQSIHELFPTMLEADKDSNWFTMKKIPGLTASSMFAAELLQPRQLVRILEDLQTIHGCGTKTEENIYLNYCSKIQTRYETFAEIYQKLTGSEQMHTELIRYFTEYEEQKLGVSSKVIHGDPVFTNIIVSKHDRNYFIDPRGKLGDKCTTSGDQLYDYAKVYQSILGYDEILLHKTVTPTYRDSLMRTFEAYIHEHFDRETFPKIKMITKALLFTLLPLHEQDERISKYYKLSQSIKE